MKGVVKDFHIHDFSHAIDEVWIEPVSDNYIPDYILVRVYPENKTTTLKRVAEEYEKLGGLMFDGKFISDHVEALYVNQRRLSVMLGLLSFIAIVISSMGMLAMSIYFTRQRARDMAVRKVFGATPRGVLGLLMGGFLKLVGVAFVIAVPIIYLLMQEWLSGYVYRIRLTPVPFLIAGGIVLLIAVLTVAGHSLKVAVSNPVNSLKAE